MTFSKFHWSVQVRNLCWFQRSCKITVKTFFLAINIFRAMSGDLLLQLQA